MSFPHVDYRDLSDFTLPVSRMSPGLLYVIVRWEPEGESNLLWTGEVVIRWDEDLIKVLKDSEIWTNYFWSNGHGTAEYDRTRLAVQVTGPAILGISGHLRALANIQAGNRSSDYAVPAKRSRKQRVAVITDTEPPTRPLEFDDED